MCTFQQNIKTDRSFDNLFCGETLDPGTHMDVTTHGRENYIKTVWKLQWFMDVVKEDATDRVIGWRQRICCDDPPKEISQ